MDITPGQLRAARAMLDLSQQQLATLAGMHINALIRWESGQSKPRISTTERMAAVLTKMGLKLLPGEGVARTGSTWSIQTVDGSNFLSDIVSDLLAHIGFKGENLMVSPDEELFWRNDKFSIAKLYAARKKLQFREKIIVPPSNKRFLSPKTIYRVLPASLIGTISWCTYGNHVALINLEAHQSIIIESSNYADTQRRLFNALWGRAKPVK